MIRNNLKDILDERNINIAEACRRTGLGRSVLGRLYRNEVTNLSLETLDALCNGLSITAADLFPFVPESQMTKEDVVHITEREMHVKAYTNMRKRNARKKSKEEL